MTWSEEDLAAIFERTDGYCPYCGKKLSWSNYGDLDARGGWEVDHVKPRSEGGGDDLENLVPADGCNREKGTRDAKEFADEFEYDSTMAGVYHAAGLPDGSVGLSRRKHRRS